MRHSTACGSSLARGIPIRTRWTQHCRAAGNSERRRTQPRRGVRGGGPRGREHGARRPHADRGRPRHSVHGPRLRRRGPVRAACAEAAPAGVFGCTSTGGFTHAEQVPSGCVAALLAADDASYGLCHLERDEDDIAGSSRHARRAGARPRRRPLCQLRAAAADRRADPDQREIARGAYEVTTAVIPFVGGAAGRQPDLEQHAHVRRGTRAHDGDRGGLDQLRAPDGRQRRPWLAARRQADARDPGRGHGRPRARRHARARGLPRGAGRLARAHGLRVLPQGDEQPGRPAECARALRRPAAARLPSRRAAGSTSTPASRSRASSR